MAQKHRLVLKDYPKNERPRERLLDLGPSALSHAELLAILLRSGRVEHTACDLARELLKQSGSLTGLLNLKAADLLKISGIGPAKASSLLACFELGRRLLEEKARERPLADSAEALYHYLSQHLSHRREECLLAALLDARLQVVKILDLAQGDGQQVLFSLSAILKKIVSEGLPAFILVHNHPSGDLRPSPADLQVTERFRQACEVLELKLYDHLIIGAGGYFSFLEEGLLEEPL